MVKTKSVLCEQRGRGFIADARVRIVTFKPLRDVSND